MSQSIKKNIAYNTIYQIFTILTPFITAPYVSRVIGAKGVGIYSYTSSYMIFFMLFAALGTGSYGAREIARNRDNKLLMSQTFWEIECMTILTSTLCLIVWEIFVLFNKSYQIYFFALSPCFIATALDITWFFNGLELFKKLIIRNVIIKIIGIALLFALIRTPNDLELYIWIQSITGIVSSLAMWLYIPSLVEKIPIKSLKLRKHHKETWIYFVPTISTSIYTVLDKTLIGLITNDTYQNGYYEQASKIIGMVKSIVFSAVNTVVGMRVSYLFAKKKYNEIKKRIIDAFDYIMMIGVGCVFGMIAVIDEFVPVFFGDGYEPVSFMIKVMSPIIIIIGISNCLGSLYYSPSGRRAQSAKYIIIGSITNLIMNLCMIPMFGANGAIVSSLTAELIITILYITNSGEYFKTIYLVKYSYKRVIAGGLMVIGVRVVSKHMLDNDFVKLLVEIFVGIMIYGICLLVMKDKLLYRLISIFKKR